MPPAPPSTLLIMTIGIEWHNSVQLYRMKLVANFFLLHVEMNYDDYFNSSSSNRKAYTVHN